MTLAKTREGRDVEVRLIPSLQPEPSVRILLMAWLGQWKTEKSTGFALSMDLRKVQRKDLPCGRYKSNDRERTASLQ
jgi:hypothetical protein